MMICYRHSVWIAVNEDAKDAMHPQLSLISDHAQGDVRLEWW
jgi:hypothetical protein